MKATVTVRDVLIEDSHLIRMAQMAPNHFTYGTVDFVVLDLVRAGLACLDVGDTTGVFLTQAGRAFLSAHDAEVREVAADYRGPAVQRSFWSSDLGLIGAGAGGVLVGMALVIAYLHFVAGTI